MAEELPGCFDPYLRYAISTGFRNVVFFGQRDLPEPHREPELKLFLFVELIDAKLADDFEQAISRRGFGVEFGPVEAKSRYLTMRALKAAVGPDSFKAWNDHVRRVELSLPLKPAEVEKSFRKVAPADRTASTDPPTSVLIGLLDDGGPFAAAQFVKASGGTRVRGVWDQNERPDRTPIPVDATSVFGEKPSDFGYGLEFLRDSVQGPSTRQVGLNEWMKLHTSTSGAIDEDGCYAEAKFRTLAHKRSHGAHIMDVLAGRIPVSARIGRRDPPSWQPGTDPAAGADIVFVQFPDDCIRDATGVWLKGYVVDGIRYIMSFVDPSKTPNVLINISYGPTTGPHDGTAELESALTELVTKYDGSPGTAKLEIFLAAGNAYLSEGHIRYARTTSAQTDAVDWTWRIPPDNSALCFAEIWMKKDCASGVIVTLGSPGGLEFRSDTGPVPPPPGTALPPYTGAYSPVSWGDSEVWLLAVEPTVARSAVVPEHGNWTVTVEGIHEHAELHAYVARTDPNMGVRSGARRSYFVDAEWQRTRSAAAGCTRKDGEFDKAGSLIKRHGSLNGIATANDACVHVAGGYILANGRKSTYSSAGPARGGPRVGPDLVLPCDESYALQGIRGGGNRSGATFRLIGTSTAAPQLARQFGKVAGGANLPSPSLVPSNSSDIEERGGGNLDPP